MNLKTTLKIASKELMANKLRSILTMLGVIIGVSSIIIIVSLGQGMKNYISENLFENAKTVNINVYSWDQSKAMDYKETYDFYSKLGIDVISPSLDGNQQVQYKEEAKSISIKGVNEHFMTINSKKIAEGRNISVVDVDRKINSVVINNHTKQQYFSNEKAIGQLLSINGIEYKVVGVLEVGKSSMFEFVQEQVYIPITSFQRDIYNGDITSISLGAKSKEEVMALSQKVDDALYAHYKSSMTEEDLANSQWGNGHYYIANPEKELGELNKVLRILSLGLGGIAGISLLVGGIGIMNIMFVSVTERTREIGIRKAIGAKRKTIVHQFLIEAALVSGIGGAIGLAFAFAINQIIGIFAPIQPVISIPVMLIAIGFSALIGIVFGIYPANKAAKLRPIDALRYE